MGIKTACGIEKYNILVQPTVKNGGGVPVYASVGL